MALSLSLQAREYSWSWWPLPMAVPDTCQEQLLYVGEVSAVSSSGEVAPTWLHANRNGSISKSPHSGNLRLGLVKPATRPGRWYDYDGAIILSGQIQSGRPVGTGYFSELYGHVRLFIVDVTVGIKPISHPFGDDELTAGDLLFSNNAHPIPQISVGIDKYTSFPGLFGYLEIRGGVTHGWLGDNNAYVSKTMLHHKYIGGRAGGRLPVNLSYELHHAVQLGGYTSGGVDLGNDFSSYLQAVLGRKGGATRSEQLNRQGNHMISQTLCLTAKGEGWHVDLYWQDFQEDGGINIMGFKCNSKDGRWGIHASQDKWPYISGVTFEVIQMTDQSGPWHDRDGMVFGGKDSYYSNGVYKQGWTYFGRSICSPLLSPDNNRVWAYHGGVKGDIYGFRYRALCTYANNYGTYSSPAKTHNTAFLLEVKKTVPQAWGLEFGIALAGDFGSQYGNQFGGLITIRKQGIIKKW